MAFTRKNFITRLIQAGLLGILLLITFLLGSKLFQEKTAVPVPAMEFAVVIQIAVNINLKK